MHHTARVLVSLYDAALLEYVLVTPVYGAVLRRSFGYGFRSRGKNLPSGGNTKDMAQGSSVNSSVSDGMRGGMHVSGRNNSPRSLAVKGVDKKQTCPMGET